MKVFRWLLTLGGLTLMLMGGVIFIHALTAPPLAEMRRPVQVAMQPRAAGVTRLAVIGDFGANTQAEGDVAALVTGWQPDAVLTVGDNNYPDGSATTIDANIGKYYAAFIHPYQGAYGPGATSNRFFPTLGNHDWRTRDGAPPLPYPSLDYFALPGNERYYDVVVGAVHVFVVDSDPHEPDGIEATSFQADWLRNSLKESVAPWRIVLLHHPPYSSSTVHGSTPALQWPYASWGATAVLAGHDHSYERIARDGIVYFVNGIGGADLYPLGAPVAGSQFRFNADYGAMLIEATTEVMTYTLATRTGAIQDIYVQHATDYPPPAAPFHSDIMLRVTGSENDAEESLTSHQVTLTSTDLEFVSDPAHPDETQLVGMRFIDVAVPPGYPIQRAYLELTVDEIADIPTSLIIAGEASDAAQPFQSLTYDLSARPRTSASISWSNVPAWTVVGARWRTPDLTPIIQEIVNRPGWQTGNPLVLLIEGNGRRTAEAYDGDSKAAPLLTVEVLLPHHLFLPTAQRP